MGKITYLEILESPREWEQDLAVNRGASGQEDMSRLLRTTIPRLRDSVLKLKTAEVAASEFETLKVVVSVSEYGEKICHPILERVSRDLVGCIAAGDADATASVRARLIRIAEHLIAHQALLPMS